MRIADRVDKRRRVACASIACFIAAGGLSALVGCAAPPAAIRPLPAVEYRVEDWKFADRIGQRLLTEHYALHTTVRDPRLLRALPQALESYYLYYRSLVPTTRRPRERMEVFLFAERAEFEEFTRRFGGAKAPLMLKIRGGGYSDEGRSVIQYVSHDATFPLLAHEGFHQFLYHCSGPDVPAWLNEGLAVLCEGQRWTDAGLTQFDPDYNPLRRNALVEAFQTRKVLPLEELLRINAGHVVGGPPRQIAAYYGQVWMLMRFLQGGVDGKYAAGFERLRADVARHDVETLVQAIRLRADADEPPTGNAGANGEAAPSAGETLFRGYISEDVAAVEREFEAFVRDRLLNPQSGGFAAPR